jgi:hypothetical protein
MFSARVTSWDARAAARAAMLAAAALAIACVVTAATDEGGLAWGVRLGRALPLSPPCAALGTWLALAPARARGETLALAALGRPPLARVLGAVIGGASVALVAALTLGVARGVDVSGFYPRVPHATAFAFEGGTFVSNDGWRVDGAGAPSRDASAVRAAPAPLPEHARGAAALATAMAGIALPLLAARTSRRARPLVLAGLGGTAVVAVVAFQAAAAGRVPVFVASLPPLALLVLAAPSYRESRWPKAKSQK